MNVNDIVKFKEVKDAGDENARFIVREICGDRVVVEFITTMAIKPQYLFMENELEVVE